MQNNSSEKLNNAKKRFDGAFERLESFLEKTKAHTDKERSIRTDIIKDLDLHIKSLGNILNPNSEGN